MALEIKWTKIALTDFTNIQDYLFKEWGEASVKKFTKKVFGFLDLLSEFPKIGAIENTELNIRGFVIVKQIALFYKIRGGHIILLRFYDTRQNPKNNKIL